MTSTNSISVSLFIIVFSSSVILPSNFFFPSGTTTVRRIVPESPSVPALRFGHTLVADPQRNQLLLFGGRNSVESFSDVWSFNLSKGAWTQLVINKSETSSSSKSSSTMTSPTLQSNSNIIDEQSASRKLEKRSSRKAERVR